MCAAFDKASSILSNGFWNIKSRSSNSYKHHGRKPTDEIVSIGLRSHVFKNTRRRSALVQFTYLRGKDVAYRVSRYRDGAQRRVRAITFPHIKPVAGLHEKHDG